MDSPAHALRTFLVGMETVYADVELVKVCSGPCELYFHEMAATEKPNNNLVDRKSSEYLAQLLNDKKQLNALPNVFVHVEKILDEGRAWFLTRLMVKCGDAGLQFRVSRVNSTQLNRKLRTQVYTPLCPHLISNVLVQLMKTMV